jgi:predicted dehydrogenase
MSEKKNDSVGVGIIGAGWMGKTHADIYRQTANARLVAVAETSAEAAEAFVSNYPVDHHSDFAQMLERTDIDLVDVCTPPPSHRKITLDAINAGKHVSIQKPIALTIEDADAIVAAAESADTKVMVSYMFRAAKLTRTMAQMIKDGEIGKPLMAYHRMFIPSWRPGPWTWNEDISGGMIIEMLTHGFDMFMWYFGEIETVTAEGIDGLNKGFHDNVSILLKFSSGVVGVIQGSWTAADLFPTAKTEVIGTEGSIYVNGGTFRSPLYELTLCKGSKAITSAYPGKGHAEKIEYMVESILKDRPLEYCTTKQGRAALEVAIAAKISLAEHHPVNLPLSTNER